MAFEQKPQIVVKRPAAFPVGQPFAVGRIAEEYAVLLGQLQRTQVLCFYGDAIGKARLLDVFFAQADGLGVDIASADIKGGFGLVRFLGFPGAGLSWYPAA